jgi:regulator of sigma E protease
MLVTIIASLIIIGILIFVHEFGHFVAAKKAGMGIEEFGFGYPPRIWAKKIGETVYSVNALPVGGFVKIMGEELAERAPKDKKEKMFYSKSKKARTAVLLTGVLMNFVLAVVAFSVIYTKIGIPTKSDKVRILTVLENSPAAQAGLKEEDVVVAADGKEIKEIETFVKLAEEKAGEEIDIKVKREEKSLSVIVAPRKEPPRDEGPLGVVISQIEMKFFPLWQMPIRGTIEGFKEALAWTRLVLSALAGMVFQLVTAGKIPKDIAGPVGIFQITGAAVQSGWLAVLQFLGILSVNLMILNILPFPALDGGRLVFIGYEVVTGKRPKPSLERWANTMGMIFIIFLLVLVTINDVRRIIEMSGLLNRLSPLENLLPF